MTVLGRRKFFEFGVGLASALSGCVSDPMRDTHGSRPPGPVIPGATERGTPPVLAFGSSFRDHIRRIGGDSSGIGNAGIDYAPHPGAERTLICPVAAGIVIGHRDSATISGMTITIAHGLGWKSEYAHLEARFVGYGTGRVSRGDIVAVMGASGTGAGRGGTRGPLRHTHLNLWAPAFTPLFQGIEIQPWPNNNPGYRYLVDAEAFSLGGSATGLPYRRPDDDALDHAFLQTHEAAVRYCDALLDTLGDADAAGAKERNRFERETEFAYNVDLRVWYLWQRLSGAQHPFNVATVGEHRHALRAFVNGVPQLGAPVVEPTRRSEYRMLRAQPIRVYQDQRDFGAGGSR